MILTPKREDVSWDVEQDSEEVHYGYTYDRLPVGAPKYVFSGSEWEIRAEIGPSQKYAELVSRLGEDKANEAWEVLFG